MKATAWTREQNVEADLLTNRALDERMPFPDWLELEIPTT